MAINYDAIKATRTGSSSKTKGIYFSRETEADRVAELEKVEAAGWNLKSLMTATVQDLIASKKL